jgi:hypothetical protein
LENGLAGESANPGSFSERDKMDETVVVEDALDEVDENELTELLEELPEVDLEEEDDDDDPEPDRDDVGVWYGDDVAEKE